MPEKKVQCPHCSEIFKLDIPEAQQGDLQPVTMKQLEEILNKAPGDLDHRHKTADDFLDCPECRLWFDKTAQRYQVTEKEPEPKPEPEPEPKPEPEPEPAAKKPAFGSVFSAKTGGEHEHG